MPGKKRSQDLNRDQAYTAGMRFYSCWGKVARRLETGVRVVPLNVAVGDKYRNRTRR